jgi:uncharacterized protein
MNDESNLLIDTHTHIFPPELIARRAELCLDQAETRFAECYASPKAKMSTAEDLILALDAANIAKAVVCGYAFANQALCALSNDYIIAAVRQYPQRLIGLGAVQPLAGAKAIYETERCLQAGLKGLGELTADGQGFDPADKATFQDLAGLLIKYSAVLMFHASEPVGHLYPGKGKTSPAKILALAQNFPALKIIAAHWGGGLPFYHLMPEVAQQAQNLYYDTAATTYLYRFGVFRAVVDLAGVDKVLFASDYPLLNPAKLLKRVREEAFLTETELSAILGGNAAKLFNLTTI